MKKILALLCAVFALQTKATLILGTSGSEPSLSFQEHQYLAQRFAITGDLDLDSVNLYFNNSVGSPFVADFLITDVLGPGANVLFSTTANISDGTVNIPASVTLSPGAYFILLATTAPLPANSSWATTGSIFDESFGAVGKTFFSGSQNIAAPEESPFIEAIGVFLNFDLHGEFTGVNDLVAARDILNTTTGIVSASVPDSASSAALMAIGLIALSRRR